MEPLKALGALIALGTAFGCLADTPSDVLVKDIHLQSFFHTRQPWEVKIYQPTGEDADTGKIPSGFVSLGQTKRRTASLS